MPSLSASSAQTSELCWKDAITLACMLRSREVSAREVITAHVDRVKAVDGTVNAVVTRVSTRRSTRPKPRTRRWPPAWNPACCTACRSRTRTWSRRLADQVSEFFEDIDVLACPATQVAPFDVNLDWVHEIDGVPQENYLDWMASAYLISATGLPALSVPAGFTPDGLPVGLQLVGRRRADWELLQVAHAFEAATNYGSVPPAL